MLPYLTGMSGLFYLGGALVLGAGIPLLRNRSCWIRRTSCFAMKVFNYSIVYLMALFAFLLLDHYLDAPVLRHGMMPLQRVTRTQLA